MPDFLTPIAATVALIAAALAQHSINRANQLDVSMQQMLKSNAEVKAELIEVKRLLRHEKRKRGHDASS